MPIFLQTYQVMPQWKKAASQFSALMARAWVRTIQCVLFKSPSFKWKTPLSRMGGISLKIERRTFSGAPGFSPQRSIFGVIQRDRRILSAPYRWTSILLLFKCSNYNSFSKWDITHDTNNNIFLTSPYLPSAWAGPNMIGSNRVPVPWRLIPVDGKFY